MAKAIMIQGTMSNAGKSFLVAGICRILKQDGYRVAPFKSQNMALNSYITEDGFEMGRAQVMQAEACGIEPSVYMNPILLKPTTDVGSQVIVNGVPRGNMRASDYFKYKTELIPDILNAWQKLSEAYDVIVIEGAGSPAEINLKENDIVNMGLAELVNAPVLLVGDIDRGGVFAQLAGTLALLEEPERQRIKGFVMNKFRGDVEILRPGLDMLRDRCHVETIGVIPYTYLDLDDEDSLSERLTGESEHARDKSVGESEKNKSEKTIGGFEENESEKLIGESEENESEKTDEGFEESNFERRGNDILRIAVIRLPRISNFTDFNVLQAMDGVQVTYVSKVSELGEPHMVILPGTKSTIADLRWLRESGLEAAVLKLHSRGVTIFGICGGFQMLGEKISDPLGVETTEEGAVVSEISNGKGNGVSDRESGQNQKKGGSFIAGMGILPLETVFEGEKVRRRITGTSGKLTGEYTMASEKQVSGYEIHMGRTAAVKCRDIDRSEKESVSGRKKENQSHENPETDFGETVWQTAGLIYQKGHVFGTYVHGIFDGQEFRESFLDVVAKRNNIELAAQTVTDYRTYKQLQYDKLADVVRGGMDMKKFYEILGLFPDRYFSDEKGRGSDGSRRSREDGRGYLHLYYGNGKGKTTAAVGLAVRAAGAGKKVVFCQFLKSGETGELSVLGCTPGIRILRSGERFGFSWTLSEEEKARLREIHTNLFMEAMELAEAGQCDVLILDEVCDALQKKLMDEELFYRWLETAHADGGTERSPDQSGISAVQADGTGQKNGTGRNFQKIYGCEWVLTGRTPDARILAAADYVTQMKKERHPFDDGVKARRGIEY